MATRIGLDLNAIFAEREKRWPALMRWEACYLALWTRRRALNSEENKHADRERAKASAGFPPVLDAQDPFLSTGLVVGKHQAFQRRVLRALHNQGIGHEVLSPREMVVAARESVLPETVGSGWRPRLLGDPVPPRELGPDEDSAADPLLPPTLRDQALAAAETRELSLSTVQVGAHAWAHLDMKLGPVNPRPFAELVRHMAETGVPWRASFLMEGGGEFFFAFKEIASTVLGFGQNKLIFQNIETNRRFREAQEGRDITVRLRVSFATWAPAGDPERLRLRRAVLEHRLQSWGDTQFTHIAGDPLAGVMSSSLGMAPASTAQPGQARLLPALKVAPWARPGSPWTRGPVLFRSPDGRIWPFDPAGSGRPRVLNLYSGPSRHGKSVLANTNLLGLCLSGAALGPSGAKLPLIGKIDIGRSVEGLVVLLQEALPEDRRHEALHVALQFIAEHAANVLDTQVACRKPLELERAFQVNFLSLATTPLGGVPFEAMDQLIPLALSEAYRMFGTDGPNRRTKPFVPGRDPRVDAALRRHLIALRHDAWWWDAVDALCDAGDHAHAEIAQRHAVPLLEDLVTAARSEQVKQLFAKVMPRNPENAIEMFTRYLQAFIRRYPTFNMPTAIDFGAARVIAIDLGAVAPTGSPDADRQTALVYMLARHMIARNLFLHPEYAHEVPYRVRAFHAERMRELHETAKCLEYDEVHRTEKQPQVREQLNRDGREGPKHNVMLGLSSQSAEDFGKYLLDHATAHFVCGAGAADEAAQVSKLLSFSQATAQIVERRLNGPLPDGGGAPFVLAAKVNDVAYEQLLVNSLGPVELWALSTTPEDVALRARMYARLGSSEALRRLAAVFPSGTAGREVRRRKEARVRLGEGDAAAEAGVVQELSDELFAGVGIGMVLREGA